MSNDYTLYLRIGFSIRESVFEKLFLKAVEGVYHLEDRFDQKTGKKIEPIKIWDTPSKNYIEFEGVEYYSLRAFCYSTGVDKLKNKLGCNISYSNAYLLNKDESSIDFSVNIPGDLKSIDIGHVNFVFIPTDIQTIKQCEPQLLKIKEKLENFGLQPGEPEIFVSYEIS